MDLDDRITIATPEGVELNVQLAGLGSRFIAGIADLIIQLILLVVLVLITGAISGGGALDLVAAVIGIFLIWFGYPIAFEVLARGRTPGKRLTQLRVVREGGRAVDLPASTIRNFMRLLEGPILMYLPAMISILVTRHNQRLGDLAAGTLVVREEPRLGARPVTPVPTTGVIPSWEGWDVTAVSEADLATVRRFLGRRESLDPGPRAALARRMAEALSPKVAGAPREGDPERFLEALVEAKSRRAQGP